MKNQNVVGFYLLILLLVLACYLTSCQKEHAKYRLNPKFHVGQLVQFEKSIEHDNGPNGKKMSDIPQPFKIVSFYYNDIWRDNWYYIQEPDGTIYGSEVDELSLQDWNGTLQK